jgi:nucleoside 2-deoxyribosyltransferase
MWKRYQASCRAAAKLFRAGIVVFNPLANTVPAIELGGLSLEHEEFLEIDLQILRRCDEVLVLGLDGWEQSRGVVREMLAAMAQRKPVTLIREPDIESLPGIPETAQTFLTSSIFYGHD